MAIQMHHTITTERLLMFMAEGITQQGLTPHQRDFVYASICAAITYAELRQAEAGCVGIRRAVTA